MVTPTLVLDTSAYSAFRRGLTAATEAIQLAEMILVPTIVLGELFAGFDLGARAEQNRRELDNFLASSRVALLPVTRFTAERYALLYAYLRSIGRPIPTNDLWIAAGVWERSSILLTGDAHFESIPQIIVRRV